MAKKVSGKPVSAITVTAAARKLGHLGGLKGGPARARQLTSGQRSSIARKGAYAKRRKS